MNDISFTTHALACFGGAAATMILIAGLSPATTVHRQYPAPVVVAGPPAYTPPGARRFDDSYVMCAQ